MMALESEVDGSQQRGGGVTGRTSPVQVRCTAIPAVLWQPCRGGSVRIGSAEYFHYLPQKSFSGKVGGTNWEAGIDIYTLLYIKQIINQDLLLQRPPTPRPRTGWYQSMACLEPGSMTGGEQWVKLKPSPPPYSMEKLSSKKPVPFHKKTGDS